MNDFFTMGSDPIVFTLSASSASRQFPLLISVRNFPTS